MSRHTKIVATLGPASSDPTVLESMVHAGVDVVRMNFSHGTPEDHIARANAIREVSARTRRPGSTKVSGFRSSAIASGME